MGLPDWRRNAPKAKIQVRDPVLKVDHELRDQDMYLFMINGNAKTGIHRKATLHRRFKEQKDDWDVKVISVCRDGNARLSTIINKELYSKTRYGKT